MDKSSNEEELFLREIPKKAKEEEDKISGTKGLFVRIKTEPEYRLKFLSFLCLAWAFFILGWILGQFGPSLFDLQLITNTDLEEASFFYMAHNIGYLIGSLVSGALIGKCDCNFLLFVTMAMYGLSVFVIPWCFVSWTMISAHALRGIAGGLLDTVGNSELLNLFGKQVSPYMQAMHFWFAVGGIVSPLATAPFLSGEHCFLSNETTSRSPIVLQVTDESMVFNYSYFEMPNATESPSTISTCGPEESNILIPYTLSGVIAISSSVLFLIVYLKSKKMMKKTTSQTDTVRNERTLTFLTKIVILSIMSVIFLLYTAMEDTVGAFVATFCVEQMRMTKTEASYVTAIFWAFFAFGRLSGILVGKLLRPISLVSVYSFFLMTSFLLLAFAPSINSPVTIWISTSLTGLAMSILFPILFTWTEQDFLLVTGPIASLFIMMSTAGSIASPAALGYLIEEVDPMWYAYILLGESIGVILFFAIAVILKKKLPQLKDSPHMDVSIDLVKPIQDKSVIVSGLVSDSEQL